MCSTVSESEGPGSRRVALLSEKDREEIDESVDGLRGGRGGRDLGGGSKLMSGAECLCVARAAAGLLATGGGVLLNSRIPFSCFPLLMRTWGGIADGHSLGPSSTIQSFRSINEVFRPRFGGDGDGDLFSGRWGGVNGAIGWNESEVGEMGDSRMLVGG